MRVFVAKGTNHLFINKEIITESTYQAFYGFSVMGWEVVFYEGDPPVGLSREDVVVGWITQVKRALVNIGITPPSELDYPEDLRPYLRRNVWEGKLNDIYTSPEKWPVFVKPVKGKQFDGKLITSLKDLVGLGDQMEDRKIWCSNPVNFVSEYRCFVRYGKLLDARRYKGDFRVHPNYTIIESCIKDYTTHPAAYALDFGVDDKGNTVLVEVNDAFALGSYGLHFSDYAKMISARWSELVGIPDPCLF
jgi:hypothetical protein